MRRHRPDRRRPTTIDPRDIIDPRQREPLVIVIAREAAVRIAVAPMPSYHASPVGGTYEDRREADRRRNADLADLARRHAWAERQEAMIAADRPSR